MACSPKIDGWLDSAVDGPSVLRSLDGIHELLVDAMGMVPHGQEAQRHRYRMGGDGQPGRFYDVVEDQQSSIGRPGAGTVHHIAFRAKHDEEQHLWQQLLREKGYGVTPVRDRNYFRSIYFSTPGGVLFEIATDPPGFTVDEPMEQLGQSLKLPSQYEPRREEIEAHLPPLVGGKFKHVFVPPENHHDPRTLVTLHGTGGNEHDLIDLARRIDASTSILSPRGKVLENGMPRFFKRLADGVFDEADVVRRAHELADFLISAGPQYGRSLEDFVALGYSNGANIAAAVLLLRPEVFSQAVLLRPMLPLKNLASIQLTGKNILILRGQRDTIIPSASTDELVRLLKHSGADVTEIAVDAGHELTATDIEAVRHWITASAAHQNRSMSSAN